MRRHIEKKKARGDEHQASTMPAFFFYEWKKQKRQNQLNDVYYKHNTFLYLLQIQLSTDPF